MRLCGIEIDAVALVEHECFLANGQFECSFGHEIELLSLVRVGMHWMIFGFGLHGHHEWVGTSASESACQTLVCIFLASLHAHALSLACQEVKAHVWFFAKEQHIECNAVFL